MKNKKKKLPRGRGKNQSRKWNAIEVVAADNSDLRKSLKK
jgi:hypothetical protein